MLTVALLVIIAASLAVTIEAVVERRRLRARIQRARMHVPKDEATGLLSHRAFRDRVMGEIKRAKRAGGNVWLTVWTVYEGDADQFGRVAADGLRFPETGFRLAERVFAFSRPNATDAQRDDLSRRLSRGATRARATVGHAEWSHEMPEDAMVLLYDAIGNMQ